METYNKLKEKQIQLCKPMNKEYVLKKLKKGKKEAMNDSDDLAHEWLRNRSSGKRNGAVDDDGEEEREVDKFIDGFLEKRIVHHVRAAKEERIENT